MSNDKSSKKFDPIEEAKRIAEGKKPEPAPAPVDTAAPAGAPAGAAAPAKVTKYEPKLEPPKKKYRVLEPARMVWQGSTIQFKKHDELDPAGYGGEAGIAKLRENGLELKEIEVK